MIDIAWTHLLPRPARMPWRLHTPSLAFVSPLVGSIQTASLPGARWGCELIWSPMPSLQAAPIEALLASLRGRVNRLVLWNIARRALTGSGGGTPIVNGAGQLGTSIAVSGLPASVTGWANVGDMVGIGGELKMLTARVDSGGTGLATLQIAPPMRAAPAHGSAIVVTQPTARFVAAENQVGWVYESPLVVTELRIDLIEAF